MLLSHYADCGTYSLLSPYLYLFDFDSFCEEFTDLPPFLSEMELTATNLQHRRAKKAAF